MSGAPSVLPLSTTVTRIVAVRGGCARRLSRQRRRSASAPWLTITTSRSTERSSGGMRRKLVGAFAAHDRPRRPHQDLQVGQQREVVQVVALHRQPLLEGQVAAAVDLHRPGNAGLDGKAAALALVVEGDD